jgi:hypothetical protein
LPDEKIYKYDFEPQGYVQALSWQEKTRARENQVITVIARRPKADAAIHSLYDRIWIASLRSQ